MAISKKIRKHHVGGLENLSDPRVPKAPLEVYLRSAEGETFHVSTLHEGIYHLLSNEGYRLSVYERPDGAAGPTFGVVIRREGSHLAATIQAPIIDYVRLYLGFGQLKSEIHLDLTPKTPKPRPYRVVDEVRSLADFLVDEEGNSVDPSTLPEIPETEEVEVLIETF